MNFKKDNTEEVISQEDYERLVENHKVSFKETEDRVTHRLDDDGRGIGELALFPITENKTA